jgi:hypothetical protein
MLQRIIQCGRLETALGELEFDASAGLVPVFGGFLDLIAMLEFGAADE